MRKISTGAYSIPLTLPQVAFMHHREVFRRSQVAISIPVEVFSGFHRCRFCTTPTLATLYLYQQLPIKIQKNGIIIASPNASLAILILKSEKSADVLG